MGKWRQVKTWLTGPRRAVALVLLAWVALVIIGDGQKPVNPQQFTVPDLGDFLTAMALLAALFLLALLPFIISGKQMDGVPRQRRSVWGLLMMFGLAIIAMLVLDLDELSLPEEQQQENPESVPAPETTEVVEPTDGDSVVLIIVALGAAGAVLLWTRRRLATTLDAQNQPGVDVEIGTAINLAADHLLHGTDPRSSVLAAYAALESSLGAQGRGRKATETPTEHLRRVLAQLPDIANPAVKLGQLYEVARFSDSPITLADQQLAASQLDRARQHLEPKMDTLQ